MRRPAGGAVLGVRSVLLLTGVVLALLLPPLLPPGRSVPGVGDDARPVRLLPDDEPADDPPPTPPAAGMLLLDPVAHAADERLGASVVRALLEAATPTPAATATAAVPTAASATPTATPAPRVAVAGGRATVPILMYHYVRVVADPQDRLGIGLSVTPAAFAEQMAWLARAGYEPITLADLHRAVRGEIGLPRRPIVLTFDDGYADYYEAAWPVLRRHGFASTIFIITGLIDRPGYLTRARLAELAASGLVEIGSHTVSHPDLTTLAPERQADEVRASKASLEDWLGRPVVSFCYPAGRYHAATLEMVRAAGYRAAVTTAPGATQTVATALEWPRLRVDGPGSAAALAAALGHARP